MTSSQTPKIPKLTEAVVSACRYRSESSIELDNILLVVAQTGVYLYASFNIIGSHFSNDLTSLGTSVMAIAQVSP